MFISSIMDKQIVVICDKEDYIAVIMNKLLMHVASRMNLTNITQATEMLQKNKSHMIRLISSSKIGKTNRLRSKNMVFL